MSDKTKEIVAEFEYAKENGDNIHSDLDFDFDMKEKMRKPLHDCLDEWLDKSKGEGGFYLRNANHHFEDYFKLSEESQSQPKRSPLPNGVLPMTSEELLEFNQHMELTEIKKVFVKNGFIYYTFFDLDIILSDVKAILYLNTLFDLNMEAKSE